MYVCHYLQPHPRRPQLSYSSNGGEVASAIPRPQEAAERVPATMLFFFLSHGAGPQQFLFYFFSATALLAVLVVLVDHISRNDKKRIRLHGAHESFWRRTRR